MPKHRSIILTDDEPKSSFLARIQRAYRSFTVGPMSLKDPALARYFSGGGSASSGVSVSHESSLSYSPVWAAVSVISGALSSLPLLLYKREGDNKRRYAEHSLYRILHDQPNPELTSMVFRRLLQAWALLYGNAYAEIERSKGGHRVMALWPIHPDRVQLVRERGALWYRVVNENGTQVYLEPANVLHIRGLGLSEFGGCSLIDKARDALGLGIAAERFAASFFGNGSTFGGTLSTANRLSPQARENLTNSIEARHQGVDRAHRFIVLEEGLTYTQLGVKPNEAQFIDQRNFQLTEVCRFFNITPHMLADLSNATYSNVSELQRAFYKQTLQPWQTQWEEELQAKLVSTLEQNIQLIEHETKGYLQGDPEARAELYRSMVSLGVMTINEARAAENLPPVPGGDEALVQQGFTFLSLVRPMAEAQIEATKQPEVVAPPPKKEDDEAKAENERLQRELDLARRKCQEAEDARDMAKADQVTVRAELADMTAQRDGAHAIRMADRAHGQVIEVERNQLRTDLAAAVELVATRTQERDAFAATVDVAVQRLAQADDTIADLRLTVDGMSVAEGVGKADRTALELERDDLARRLAEAETAATDLVAERDEQIAKLIEARNDLVKLTADEQSALTERDMLSADIDTLQQQLQGAELALETERAQTRSQRVVQMTAMRGLFVDTVERLLQREADRARKAQATPEKLRHWAEGFYPMHAEIVRGALKPVVDAWAALANLESDALLDRIVQAHIAASTQALQQVADVDDPDQMATVLERTLRRWETERAGAVADGLLREGMQR